MAKSYLLQRGDTYSFIMAVPKDLRGRFRSSKGKALQRVVIALGTSDAKRAKELADDKRTEWRKLFDRARQNADLTLAEVNDYARDHYNLTLARLEAEGWALPQDQKARVEAFIVGYGRALEEDNLALVEPDIAAIPGLRLDPESDTYKTLARALLRAKVDAAKGRAKALDGEASARPANFLGAAGINPLTLQAQPLTRPVRGKVTAGPLWLFEQWIAAKQPAASSVNRWRSTFLDLQSKYGTDSIREDEAKRWTRELVTADRSAKTVREVWLNSANTIYRWAQEEGHVDANPFEKVKVTVPEKITNRESKAFTDWEAKTILTAASKIKVTSVFTAAQRWVPFIQYYSGCRSGEACQLRGSDIVQIDGQWVMRLLPEAGSIKNRKPRTIPLHSDLIKQGFPAFARKNSGALFYNPNGGHAPEQDATNPRRPRAVKQRERLAGWIRELGVNDPEVSPTHGFRHLFKRLADAAGIPEKMSDYITGHSSANIARTYGQPSLADMAAALKKFPRCKI